VGFECAANFLSRHARKLQVQHHYARSLLAKALEASYTVRSNLYCEPIGLEQALQRPLHRPTVFYNKYRIHTILWATLGTDKKRPVDRKPRENAT
jgi:hypothetical protein